MRCEYCFVLMQMMSWSMHRACRCTCHHPKTAISKGDQMYEDPVTGYMVSTNAKERKTKCIAGHLCFLSFYVAKRLSGTHQTNNRVSHFWKCPLLMNQPQVTTDLQQPDPGWCCGNRCRHCPYGERPMWSRTCTQGYPWKISLLLISS